MEIDKSLVQEFDFEDCIKNIPDQMAFKIGDVADLLQIKAYVLRYWEQEFKALSPKKAINNQRIYSRKDVETAILIKKFLYVDQFSIPGARKALKEYKEEQARLVDQNKTKFLNRDADSSNGVTTNALDLKTNNHVQMNQQIVANELMPEKYIKIEEKISDLVSKIKSVKGKFEHKFFQIGL